MRAWRVAPICLLFICLTTLTEFVRPKIAASPQARKVNFERIVAPECADMTVVSDILVGGRPEDALVALQDPDEFAWQLFLNLNRQADPQKRGIIDKTRATVRQYTDDAPVLWETWALSSGGRQGRRFPTGKNLSEVFRDNGEQPMPWSQLPPLSKALQYPGKRLEAALEAEDARSTQPHGRVSVRIDPSFLGKEDGQEEVRMNEATFNTVRTQGLFSVEGLEKRFVSGTPIQFCPNAQEIKAFWRRLSDLRAENGDDTNRNHYHWRTIREGDKQETWVLTGLHIITKDLPNWFWADFEHTQYEQRAEQPSVDSTTRGDGAPHVARDDHGQPIDGMRQETQGTKWQYYRLRGTQTDFVDTQGRSTVLANTQIERGFQQTSSCITCHSRASIGLRADRTDQSRCAPKNTMLPSTLPIFLAVNPAIRGPIGSPQPDWFADPQLQQRFLQTDFLWSLPFRVMSSQNIPPSTPPNGCPSK